MENENVQQNETTNQTASQTANQTTSQATNQVKDGGSSKIINWIKSHLKLIIILIAIIIVALIAFTLISKLTQNPEQAVKNYISAVNKMDAEKIISATDIKGALAYEKCSGLLSSSDIKEFEEKYKDLDSDDIKNRKDSLKASIEYYSSSTEEKDYSIKLIRIKDMQESEDCKGLYTVNAKVRIKYNDEDGDKQDIAKSVKFMVYKNKVININLYSLLGI